VRSQDSAPDSVPMLLGRLLERSERTLETVTEIKEDARETRRELRDVHVRMAQGEMQFRSIEQRIGELKKPTVERSEAWVMHAVRWALGLIVAWQTGSLDVLVRLAGVK
jgi:hypothetical protein